DHRSYNLLVCSYLSSGEEIKDPNYYPYPEGIHIHKNTFGKGGWEPSEQLAQMTASMLGGTLPDITWDGFINEEILVEGVLPADKRLYIANNTKEEGELTFANLQASAIAKGDLTAGIKRDLAEHAGSLPPLPAIEFPGAN
ncbi:MAG: hypothetical protein RLZZ303_1328, partial [Candidatus Hydrogenedentota bacterium]